MSASDPPSAFRTISNSFRALRVRLLQSENSDLRELLWLRHSPTPHCMRLAMATKCNMAA
jgi:hypothetical protein